MLIEQIQQSTGYSYLFFIFISILVSAIALYYYWSYCRLKVANKTLESDYSSLINRKKDILETLNFQQLSVTNIGSEIQNVINEEFAATKHCLTTTEDGLFQQNFSRGNWQKIQELAERLAHFTLRNQPREEIRTEVNTQLIFESNSNMLGAILSTKQQHLQHKELAHGTLCMPTGALDKILRGIIQQSSKAAKPDSSLRLSCDVRDGYFCFSVIGRGPGIKADEIQNIELSVNMNPRFHFAKRAQDTEVDLNLASLKRMVLQFGGRLKLVSSINYVTSIYVALPLSKGFAQNNSNQAVQPSLSPSGPKSEGANVFGHGRDKVLVIDQNEDSQMRSHLALRDTYQVFACIAPLETMQIIHKTKPSVVLIEQVSSVIDPAELIDLIRSNPISNNIPIVVTCSIASQRFRVSVLRAGASCILEKPISPAELQLTVQRMIEQQQRVTEKVHETLSAYHSQQIEVPDANNSECSKGQVFIDRFNKMMAENFADEQFTREVAASHMNVCLRTLNRRLNEHYSHNFKDYLKKYRLEKAKELLNKGRTINDASFEVGFNSASYFSTCFKAEYGFVPSRLVSQCS